MSTSEGRLARSRDKRQPFSAEDAERFIPPLPIRNFLQRTRPQRVVDWGCGRGELVNWMLSQGIDAVGVEVEDGYIEAARQSLRATGNDPARVGRPEDLSKRCDAVLSYMVLEHIGDLAHAAEAMHRSVLPGAVGLHLFPGRWTPVEPHVIAPFVHWTTGRTRRGLLAGSGLLRRKARGPEPLRGWVERQERYLDDHTFYRTNAEVSRIFGAAGFEARISMLDHRLVSPHGRFPRLAELVLANFVTAHLEIRAT